VKEKDRWPGSTGARIGHVWSKEIGQSVILVPDFFLKFSVNNPQIKSYHAHEGFGNASAPAAEATPTM
jgi:hypothetical protein